jgi:hypothetical protein
LLCYVRRNYTEEDDFEDVGLTAFDYLEKLENGILSERR